MESGSGNEVGHERGHGMTVGLSTCGGVRFSGNGPGQVGYCLLALATAKPSRPELQWERDVPALKDDELILVLAPATWQCAFIGGSGTPYVEKVERRKGEVLLHVAYRHLGELGFGEGSSTVLERPKAGESLVLVVHGSIMQPPGKWEHTERAVLPIDGADSPP